MRLAHFEPRNQQSRLTNYRVSTKQLVGSINFGIKPFIHEWNFFSIFEPRLFINTGPYTYASLQISSYSRMKLRSSCINQIKNLPPATCSYTTGAFKSFLQQEGSHIWIKEKNSFYNIGININPLLTNKKYAFLQSHWFKILIPYIKIKQLLYSQLS